MIELLLTIVFAWIFILCLKLTFAIAWGAAKIIAVIIFILALPVLLGCILLAGGLILLLPVAMVASAWAILKYC